MSTKAVFSSVIFGLLIASIDLYIKTHIGVTVPNPGSFLGIAIPNTLLAIGHIVIVIAGICYISIYLRDNTSKAVGLFVLMASLSNLFDRLVFGQVTDYITILGIWFNLADLVVTLAILYIAYKLIRE